MTLETSFTVVDQWESEFPTFDRKHEYGFLQFGNQRISATIEHTAVGRYLVIDNPEGENLVVELDTTDPQPSFFGPRFKEYSDA